MIARPFARVDQEAARLRDGVEVRHLAGHRRGGRLVELPHAVLDVSLRNQDEPFEPAAQHLEVQDREAASDRGRLPPELARRRAVVAEDAREMALPEREPAVLGSLGLARQEASRALQPAARHRLLAAGVDEVHREADGEPRRAPLLAALDEELVRPDPRLERAVRLVEPPERPAEPLERLGGLAARESARA